MTERYLKKLLKKIKLSEGTISMVLGALVVVVVGVLIFNYFQGIQPSGVDQAIQDTSLQIEEPFSLPTVYQVKAGENLWRIAEKFYGSGYNWVDISKENQLKNPDLIFPEQVLNIPQAEVIQPKLAKTFGEAIAGDQYTVVKGDHLWGIAVRAYGDGYQWTRIAQANNLTNPDIIHSGNVFVIPR